MRAQLYFIARNKAIETGLYYNIARSTLSDYIKSVRLRYKLYKNKYYFYNSVL